MATVRPSGIRSNRRNGRAGEAQRCGQQHHHNVVLGGRIAGGQRPEGAEAGGVDQNRRPPQRHQLCERFDVGRGRQVGRAHLGGDAVQVGQLVAKRAQAVVAPSYQNQVVATPSQGQGNAAPIPEEAPVTTACGRIRRGP